MALPLTCLYGGINIAFYALTATLFAFGIRFKYWILHGEGRTVDVSRKGRLALEKNPALSICQFAGDGQDNSKLTPEVKALVQRRKGVSKFALHSRARPAVRKGCKLLDSQKLHGARELIGALDHYRRRPIMQNISPTAYS